MSEIGLGDPVKRTIDLPEFIQKHRELRRHSDLSLVQNLSALEPVFRTQIHQFWRRVIEQLRCTVNNLGEIDFTGSISSFGEEIVRVSVSDIRLTSTSTYTDLILDRERIRCSVLNGGIYYLNFVTSSGNEMAAQDIQKDGNPMDARKTAEHVIDRMLNILEWTGR